jgi:hypothetical protein
MQTWDGWMIALLTCRMRARAAKSSHKRKTWGSDRKLEAWVGEEQGQKVGEEETSH